MKIIFLVPYPLDESPSQRFRFEQYFSLLHSKGITFKTQSFLTLNGWQFIFQAGNGWRKAAAIMIGFARRLKILPLIPFYDFVFIHREASPIGPPVIEWFIAKILRKKIIYDFDDAIWHTDKVSEGRLEKMMRWRSKVALICRWSYKVSCGNEYLCSYARQFNSHVILNPTTIDTLHLHHPWRFEKKYTDRITLGWTGSHSTLKYIDQIVSVIQQLENQFPIRFMVIANRKPDMNLKCLHFISWSAKTEIDDLMQIDIGIMPLPDDEWAKGKCGFKALQYMALEIPTVASPVGVNTKIIQHGINGFLCDSADAWRLHLISLIKDAELRNRLGKAGRETVEKNYSVSANSNNFLSLFA